jgi:hypothetical protein
MPVLDYAAGGFDKACITVLFVGDYGNKHCPIAVSLIYLLLWSESRKDN